MPLRIHKLEGSVLTECKPEVLDALNQLLKNPPYSRKHEINEDLIRIRLNLDKLTSPEALLDAARAAGTEYRNPTPSIMLLRILSAEGRNITAELNQEVLDKLYKELFCVGMNVPRKVRRSSLWTWRHD
jgi:hypothetical protein